MRYYEGAGGDWEERAADGRGAEADQQPIVERQSAMQTFKCLACGSDRCETGDFPTVVFTPDGASRWNRWRGAGADVRVHVCRMCGFAHLLANLDKVNELTGNGETRCRKCRYILKGITEPRCPECGERI